MSSVGAFLTRWRGGPHSRSHFIPDDLEMLEAGIQYDAGHLQYYWFHIVERDRDGRERRLFKVVRLMMLTYLPKEAREQTTILEKMRKILKGVYNARVDLVYLTAGMFDHPKSGIVQCYGVQAVDPDKDVALARATEAMAGLCAAMANFEQSRLEPLTVGQAEWIRHAFETMPFATTVVGHPDPRENPRGMDGRGAPGMISPAVQMSLQQNEMVFRGMAAQEHEICQRGHCRRGRRRIGHLPASGESGPGSQHLEEQGVLHEGVQCGGVYPYDSLRSIG